MALDLILLGQLNEIHATLSQEDGAGWMTGAENILTLMGEEAKIPDVAAGMEVAKVYFDALLENNQKAEAAVLCWGFEMFDPRPQVVQEIFEAYPKYAKLALQGSSGVSKSYSMGIIALLDWAEDPWYTTWKCAAVNKEHLLSNFFSHIVRLHEASVIKLPGNCDKQLYIGDDRGKGMGGIEGVIFPLDQVSTGRFRGFHEMRRKKAHPKFGVMSRIRIFLDESGQMTEGVFSDLDSPSSHIHGVENTKIIQAYNPVDPTHITHRIAEPKNGWDTVDIEEDFSWPSKEGWYVLRLDGMKVENVIQRQFLYPGLQTWEGMQGYLAKGDRSAAYYTFGRGWFPEHGTFNTIMTTSLLDRARGSAVFHGSVTECASVDIALENDQVVLTKGRYGEAGGLILPSGERIIFSDTQGGPRSRWVLEIEQQIEIPLMADGYALAEKIKEICLTLKVPPEWLIVDKSGNGLDVFNMLRRFFGDVFGVVWSQGATNFKVLAEDTETPEKFYSHIASEMWFSTKRWIENGIMLINPNVPRSPLWEQLTGRRKAMEQTMSGKVCVESKKKYIGRGNPSCDHSDSLIMLPQLLRMRHATLPGMSHNAKNPAAAMKINGEPMFPENFEKPVPDAAMAINYLDSDGEEGKEDDIYSNFDGDSP